VAFLICGLAGSAQPYEIWPGTKFFLPQQLQRLLAFLRINFLDAVAAAHSRIPPLKDHSDLP